MRAFEELLGEEKVSADDTVFLQIATPSRERVEHYIRLRAEIEEMREVIATNVERASSLPHRERYQLLHQDLGRRLLDAHAEWLDAVEAELRR